ncbi:MAG: hypothetical protein AAF583_11915 [Pseudomonadota bacterium]
MDQSERKSVPLGYSDLTFDEGWLVSLFREWQKAKPTRAVAEHRISRALRRDQSTDHSNSSDPLFRIFSICDASIGERHFETDVLSKDEENLLFILSDEPPEGESYNDISKCQEILRCANVMLRPIMNIKRSGRDDLLRKIARSYLSFYGAA